MSTRAIRTSATADACDVCGRTLLRGEHAEIYVSGGSRRWVCELCTSRALHGGWVREGTVPEYDGASDRPARRRSLFSRLRSRRDGAPALDPRSEGELAIEEPPPEPAARAGGPGAGGSGTGGSGTGGSATGGSGTGGSGSSPRSPERRTPGSRWRERPAPRERKAPREPRHVRAVPTSVENRISSAVALFNDSEHPRTVSGIARSLGLPEVSVHPSDPAASIVNVIVSWELCWYRYEVDLSEEMPSVRSAGQGYELTELTVLERSNNATADDRGRLHLAA